jgi:nicotinamide-nucleotide amidase
MVASLASLGALIIPSAKFPVKIEIPPDKLYNRLMRAEIISIGTELLVGAILNTNARFLSQALADRGIDVYRQTTVGDNVGRIVETLERALPGSDILILSGGLGPTEDDVTSQALAKFVKKPLIVHKPTYKSIQKRLKTYKLRMTRLIARQCYVPQGSIILQNDNGTASGILYPLTHQNQKRWIVALPGPPRELEPMFLKKALPALTHLAKIKRQYFLRRSLKIAGLIEVQVAQKAQDLLKLKPPLTVGIYARPGEVELKIMTKAGSQNQAKKMIRSVENKIRARFKEKIYGADSDSLGSALGALLRKKKKTLSTAESCTGGLLSSLITDIPGSSDYYVGGLVAYDNSVKIKELGLSKSLLGKYGAVSAPVAETMAQNIRETLNTDYSIAITGIAGPSGGSTKKPVGLVYIALSSRQKTIVTKNHFSGTRAEIKDRSAKTALNLLRIALCK